MLDVVENDHVAKIKQVVLRAMTQLRHAATKDVDALARSKTQVIDAYKDAHH